MWVLSSRCLLLLVMLIALLLVLPLALLLVLLGGRRRGWRRRRRRWGWGRRRRGRRLLQPLVAPRGQGLLKRPRGALQQLRANGSMAPSLRAPAPPRRRG